jgi:hypothetical protein
MVVEKG